MKGEDSKIRATPLAVTYSTASELTGVPANTLRDHVSRGELAVIQYAKGKHRGRYVLLIEDLRAWLIRNRIPARLELTQESKRREDGEFVLSSKDGGLS